MATYREEEDPFEEDIVFDQTGLLNSSSKMNTAIRRVSSGKCVLFAKTLGLCGAFFGLGLCTAIPGPAFLSPLVDLESHLSPVSNTYIARTSGYILGSLIGGVLFDRFNRLFLLFLSLLLAAVFITVTPWCHVMWLLVTCMVILGITMGFLDTGGNVLCLDLWGRNSGPFMQALHFSFGLGAFVAPLLAAPFLEPALSNSSLSLELSHAVTESPVHLEDHSVHHRVLKRDVDVFNMSVTDSTTTQGSDFSSEIPMSVPVVPTTNIVLNASSTAVMPDIHTSSSSAVESTVSLSSTSSKPRKPKLKPDKTYGSKLGKYNWDNCHVGKPPPADLLPLSTTVMPTTASSPSSAVSSVSTIASASTTGSPASASSSTPSCSGSSGESSESTSCGGVVVNGDLTSLYDTPVTAASSQKFSSPSLTSPLPLDIASTPQGQPLTTSISLEVPPSTEAPGTVKSGSSDKSDIVMNYDFRTPSTKSSTNVMFSTPFSSEQRDELGIDVSDVSRKHIIEYGSHLSHELEPRTKIFNSNLEKDVSLEPVELNSPDPVIAGKSMESTMLSVYPHSLSLNQKKDGGEGLNDKGNVLLPSPASPSSKTEYVTVGETGSTTSQSFTDTGVISSTEQQNDPTYKEPVKLVSAVPPKHIHHKPGTFDNDTEHINTILDIFANRVEKYGFSKIQFTYFIVGIFVFSISLVFLGFLCHNPRDPKSKQQEGQGGKKITNKVVHRFLITLMAFFFFLYMGLQVTYGQLVLAFTINSSLQLPQSTGSVISVVFWGSFAAMRFASIFFAIGFDPVTMLILNFAFCTAGTFVVSLLSSHFESALWIGTALIGVGLASMFPTGILWIERYIHVSNKVAAVFVIGVALGELVCPVTVYRLMVIEPMFFAHTGLVINILCILTFVALWWLASRNGEKYSVINSNGYQLASQHDEEEDMIDMSPSGSGVILQRHGFSSEQRTLLNGNIHRGP